MEKNKYYTPELKELHIGYIATIGLIAHNDGYSVGAASEMELTIHDISLIEEGDMAIDTKYLDKSDIVSEGWIKNWKETDNYEGCYTLTTAAVVKGRSPEVWELWQYEKIVSISNELSNRHFDGECKSINELRKIQSYLGIQ